GVGLLLPAHRRHDVHDRGRGRPRASARVDRGNGRTRPGHAGHVLPRHPADARHRLRTAINTDDLLDLSIGDQENRSSGGLSWSPYLLVSCEKDKRTIPPRWSWLLRGPFRSRSIGAS